MRCDGAVLVPYGNANQSHPATGSGVLTRTARPAWRPRTCDWWSVVGQHLAIRWSKCKRHKACVKESALGNVITGTSRAASTLKSKRLNGRYKRRRCTLSKRARGPPCYTAFEKSYRRRHLAVSASVWSWRCRHEKTARRKTQRQPQFLFHSINGKNPRRPPRAQAGHSNLEKDLETRKHQFGLTCQQVRRSDDQIYRHAVTLARPRSR